MTDHKPRISVCVCTYKRPQMLLALLQSLSRQNFSHEEFEIVVVDNAATAPAAATIEIAREKFPTLSIQYALEPIQGISYARNHSVALARGELIAFIDDDEEASSDWLASLVKTYDLGGCCGVMGPVISTYPAGTKSWVRKCLAFERPRFTTGQVLGWGDGRTCNALVEASWLRRRHPTPFDPALAHSGGEDTDFFRWVVGQGGRLIWCDTATVTEIVPVSRQSIAFVLERSMRTSTVYWRARYKQVSPLARTRLAAIGLFGAIYFLILGIAWLPMGLGHAVRNWSRAIKAAGRILAFSEVNLIGYGPK